MATLPLLHFPGLSAASPDLSHALTTRHGGVSVGAWASLNLGFSNGDTAPHVLENRRRVAAAFGGTALVTGRQVHAGALPAAVEALVSDGKRIDLDLRGVLRLQLQSVGIGASRTETLGRCTYEENTRFFSYRRDGPHTGRHALVAGWRAQSERPD